MAGRAVPVSRRVFRLESAAGYGTMTNLEGRVLRGRRVRPPPPGVIDDLTLLALLAGRLGRSRYFSADPREVLDEWRRASAGGAAGYAGISYQRIDAEDGVLWRCPREDTPGTPRLFTGRFAAADGPGVVRAHPLP